MLVTDIEITHYEYRRASAQHVANVCMTLNTQIISLFCKLDLPETETSAARAAAFVSEAIRQLRKMPEFRSGRKTLEFRDTLAVLPTMQLA
jgi:hypothetical protein